MVAGKSLSNDVTSWSDITTCNKIDKPLVVYRSKTLRNDVYYNAAHKIAKLSRYYAKNEIFKQFLMACSKKTLTLLLLYY